MISKKVAATLGAGAMGAAGAGTLGAKLLGGVKIKEAGTSFSTSTEADEMAIASNLNWEEEATQGQIKTKIKEGEVTWECNLQPVTIGFGAGDNYQTKEQWESIKGKIEKDAAKRKNFVKNCAESRTSEEKINGNKSTILLEAEKTGKTWKFKDFEEILNEGFRGIQRLEGDDLEAYQSKNWEINKESETTEKTKKITVSATYSNSKKWSCSISGTYDNDPNSDTFKEEKLKKVLDAESLNPDAQKRKYLIRNCLKNNKDIKGLKVKVDGSNWIFDDDSLKKITEGIYENPK